MIDHAVVLAAGRGSRLAESVPVLHKALVEVEGEPLLARTLRLLGELGVKTTTVVTGYQGTALRAALLRHANGHPRLRFTHNRRWRQPNGLSVLAAAESTEGNYLLLMADHLFAPQIAAGLCGAQLGPGDVVLAVDRKLSDIYDIDDATKVRLVGDRIVAIGKDLSEFAAVDTGLFACSPALARALEEQAQAGHCSLSAGVQGVADEGNLRYMDIGDLWWQDVDTPGALDHARRLVRRHGTGGEG